jgi:hypothetical protein
MTPHRLCPAGRAICSAGREQATWEQLEQVRKSVEAQLHWAVLHDGDEELLELLLFERDRLSALMAHRRVGEGDDQGL